GLDLASKIESDAALRHVNVLALDVERRNQHLQLLVRRQEFHAGFISSRFRQAQRYLGCQDEDVGHCRISRRWILAVEGAPRQRFPGVTDTTCYRTEGLRERIAPVGAKYPLRRESRPRQLDLLEANAADQCEIIGELQTILERERDVVEMRI